MKQIVLEIKNRQSSIQTKFEGKSKDSKVRYNQLLEEIRQSSNQASSNLKERYDKLIKENHLEKKGLQKFNYKITYEAREILINSKLLARPNFDGENDLVFNYLILNPNQKFTRKQIREAVKIKLKKTFSKIVENLGFKKELRKLFFNVSANSIQFNNPVDTPLKLDLN